MRSYQRVGDNKSMSPLQQTATRFHLNLQLVAMPTRLRIRNVRMKVGHVARSEDGGRVMERAIIKMDDEI